MKTKAKAEVKLDWQTVKGAALAVAGLGLVWTALIEAYLHRRAVDAVVDWALGLSAVGMVVAGGGVVVGMVAVGWWLGTRK